MDKFAQSKRETGRGAFNYLREKINMPGAYLEGIFKPELDRVMTELKKLDDRIRSVITGKKIGDAEAPTDAISAKDILKNAQTNFNRREYMAGVADLGQFHRKMYDVRRDIDKFFVDINKIHHKFLFEGMPESYQNNLGELRKHMDELGKKADADHAAFVKQAGIMDFVANFATKRGRGLAAWEKRYPKQTKELREGGNRLVADAQKLLENTISNLKAMATARATRRPDEYMDIANRIKADFDKFDSGDKGFRSFYTSAVVPWLKIKDEIDAKNKSSVLPTETPADPNVGKTELGGDPVELSQTVSPTTTQVPQVSQVPQASQAGPPAGVPPGTMISAPATPAAPGAGDEAPDTQRNPQLPLPGLNQLSLPGIKLTHKRFYDSLESLSDESPVILAKYISKYASSIQGLDPETALELFAIVSKIKG